MYLYFDFKIATKKMASHANKDTTSYTNKHSVCTYNQNGLITLYGSLRDGDQDQGLQGQQQKIIQKRVQKSKENKWFCSFYLLERLSQEW